MEFAAKTADEYEKMAENFMYSALPLGVKECRRSDGGIVRFDPTTSVFGTMSKEKRIYKYWVVSPPYPDGKTAESYYVEACKK
jgi:pyocin large subunit-like protein